MQQYVGYVIADGSVAPESMFQPERAVEQGIVLLRCSHLKPDSPKTVQRAQIGLRDMGAVVPNEAALDRRKIGADNDDTDG